MVHEGRKRKPCEGLTEQHRVAVLDMPGNEDRKLRMKKSFQLIFDCKCQTNVVIPKTVNECIKRVTWRESSDDLGVEQSNGWMRPIRVPTARALKE